MVEEEFRKDEDRREVGDIWSVRIGFVDVGFKDGGGGDELRNVGSFWELLVSFGGS